MKNSISRVLSSDSQSPSFQQAQKRVCIKQSSKIIAQKFHYIENEYKQQQKLLILPNRKQKRINEKAQQQRQLKQDLKKSWLFDGKQQQYFQEDLGKIKRRKRKPSLYKIQKQHTNFAGERIQRSGYYVKKMENLRKGHPFGRIKSRDKKLLEHQQYLQRKAFKDRAQIIRKTKRQLLNLKTTFLKLSSFQTAIISLNQFIQSQLRRLYRNITSSTIDVRMRLFSSRSKIRSHLKFLFQRNLDIILQDKQSRSNFQVKNWSKEERTQIVRELLRIRATNRLLSETNPQFREDFHLLMHSYNEPNIKISSERLQVMFLKINNFVRGYSTKHLMKQSQTKLQDLSKFLHGGHLFNQQIQAVTAKRQLKNQLKIENQFTEDQIFRALQSWTLEQQTFFLSLFSAETIINKQAQIMKKMIDKFGSKDKWNRSQLLNAKINQFVQKGLCKFYDLTQQTQLQQFCRIIDGQIHQSYHFNKFYKQDRKCTIGLFDHFVELQQRISGPSHISKDKVRTIMIKLLNEKQTQKQKLSEISKRLKMFLDFCRLQELKSTKMYVKINQERKLKQEITNQSHLKVQEQSEQFQQQPKAQYQLFQEQD